MNIGMLLDSSFPPVPRVENEALTLINEWHNLHLFCLNYIGSQKNWKIINQYMSFGKPSLVSDCLAQQRLVKKYNCGLVLHERYAKDFSEKILSTYVNKEYYNSLAKNSEIVIDNHLN